MSVKVMSLVWEHSEHKGTDLLVLLAIADNAKDNGVAWPGYEYLADKSRMSKRNVQYVVKKLLDSDELDLLRRGTKGRPNVYCVGVQTLRGKPERVQSSVDSTQSGAQFHATAIAPEPYEPSKEPPVKETSAIADVPPEIKMLSEKLADRIASNGVARPSVTKMWIDAARLLVEKDGYSVKQVDWMIDWATSHEFWRTNILSMPTLRKQFARLVLTARAEEAGKNGKGADRERMIEALGRMANGDDA